MPIRAFSINAFHYRDKRHITPEARDWQTTLRHHLQKYPELKAFAALVKDGASVAITIEHVYPVDEFYTKAGRISARTYDLTNTEKCIVDVLFGLVLGVDDKYITKLVSTKRPGPAHAINMRLELNPV